MMFGTLDATPVGPVSLIAGDNGLERIAFSTLQDLKKAEAGEDETPSLKGLETVSALLAQLNEYFFGIRKVFDVEIDWDAITGFQRDVLQLTCKIPFGEFRTYGELAETLGETGGSRAVGAALANNPIPIVIPCHRVVGKDRRLHGYTAPDGIKTKAFLLTLEGNTVNNFKVALPEGPLFQGVSYE
ncbi:MAG: methylated-DNA--[protein]-cysteine S-methyltransferase [Chloroflexota bacterium]|nr:methylated-DNA--[protein]-cysteine S-methyltransferase [Chloroflexota bacterium]